MATHALGHMIYGLQIAGTNEYMNIYIFIEEQRGLFLNFPADFLFFFNLNFGMGHLSNFMDHSL